jgi:hypothetical protein
VIQTVRAPNARSFDGLQTRHHRSFDTKQAREMQQVTVLDALLLSRKSERLKYDGQAEFVPEFKHGVLSNAA